MAQPNTFRIDNGNARSFTVPADLDIGVYRFSVQAVSQQNVATPWSRFKQFNVVTRPRLTRPGKPTLQDPVVLEWQETQGATRYDLWINSVNDRGVQTRYKVERGLRVLSYTLNDLPAGTYRWWVKAYNDGASGRANAGSFWSFPKDFSAGNVKPHITSPRGISTSIRPTITWEDIDYVARWEVYISSATNQIAPITRRPA